jgi:hypothetical protein
LIELSKLKISYWVWFFCSVMLFSFLLSLVGDSKVSAANPPAGQCYYSQTIEGVNALFDGEGSGDHEGENVECPSGFSPESGKCYSFTEGATPVEFTCTDYSECSEKIIDEEKGTATIYLQDMSKCDSLIKQLKLDAGIVLKPGCYISAGYGVIQAPLDAAQGYSVECPSGFTPQSGKCYSFTEGATPVEFTCTDYSECLVNVENQLVIYLPTSASCSDFWDARRNNLEESLPDPTITKTDITDTGGNAEDKKLESASKSLHTADANNSTKLFNVTTIVVKIIGALAGIAIVGSLVVAGVQYATAGDNSGAITKAKTRIAYTLIALVIYIMVYYVAVWLIPS